MGSHKKEKSLLKATKLIVQSSTEDTAVVRHFDSSDNILLFSIMSRNTKWEDRCIHHSTREENTDHFEESLLCSY